MLIQLPNKREDQASSNAKEPFSVEQRDAENSVSLIKSPMRQTYQSYLNRAPFEQLNWCHRSRPLLLRSFPIGCYSHAEVMPKRRFSYKRFTSSRSEHTRTLRQPPLRNWSSKWTNSRAAERYVGDVNGGRGQMGFGQFVLIF